MAKFFFILLLAFKTVHGSFLGEKFAILSSLSLLSKAIKRQKPTLTYDCQVQLAYLLKSLQKEWRWALNMYDATAKLPPVIPQLGLLNQCIEVEDIGNDNKRLAGKYLLHVFPLESFVLT